MFVDDVMISLSAKNYNTTKNPGENYESLPRGTELMGRRE
jgi:hypothetical protein